MPSATAAYRNEPKGRIHSTSTFIHSHETRHRSYLLSNSVAVCSSLWYDSSIIKQKPQGTAGTWNVECGVWHFPLRMPPRSCGAFQMRLALAISVLRTVIGLVFQFWPNVMDSLLIACLMRPPSLISGYIRALRRVGSAGAASSSRLLVFKVVVATQ